MTRANTQESDSERNLGLTFSANMKRKGYIESIDRSAAEGNLVYCFMLDNFFSTEYILHIYKSMFRILLSLIIWFSFYIFTDPC